jgi:hypothetical protein
VVDGWSYGLNWGLVGFGSNNSRGSMDNISVQVVPPTSTVSRTDDFTSGTGPVVSSDAESRTGTWAAASGRFSGTPLASGDRAIQLLNLNGVAQMTGATLLELSATFKTTGLSGVVFDRYSDKDFKFAAIDMSNKQVVIGHVKGGNWSIDATVARSTLLPTVDYKLGVSVKGSTVSVTLNDQAAVGHVYNAVASDGRFGLFSKGVTASFDTITLKSNDPAVPAAQTLQQGKAQMLDAAHAALSLEQAAPLLAEGKRRWALVEDALHVAQLQGVELRIADLPGEALAQYSQGVITLDVDAGGAGWFVDATPSDDSEFTGTGAVMQAQPGGAAASRIDLLSVISHELGHAMGLGHGEAVMSEALMVGQRSTPELGFPAVLKPSLPLAVNEHPVGGVTPMAAAIDEASSTAAKAVVNIDWSAHAGEGQGGEFDVRGGHGGLPTPAQGATWKQRFVNDLAASPEKLQPNASMRLRLPTTPELSPRVSRM